MIKLPVYNYPDFTQQYTIDGRQWYFHFLWNYNNSYWSLSINNSDSVNIISGIKLIKNFDLLLKYQSYDLPQGNLYVADDKLSFSSITLDDFGVGTNLFYISPDGVI